MRSVEGVVDRLNAPSFRRFLRFAAISGTLLAAACSGGKSGSQPSSPSVSSSAGTIELVPDLSGFLQPGSTTLCYSGGERPCSIIIRTRPELNSDIINADPNTTVRVGWPRESYAGQTGDGVTVNCYVKGEQVSPYTGDTPPSDDWYEVEVPAEYAVNPALPNNHQAQVGYANTLWFNQGGALGNINHCSTTSSGDN